jgi:8-oxo-dGTP pyrophosphatase MutT (NUDIX family)
MHRKKLIQQLRDYRKAWRNESITVKRFIDFILANEGCFERNLEAGHVTGSAWLVNKKETHVLLTHHRKLNKWLQLGGHAEGDADVLRVAMREVKEESGLEAIEPVSDRIFDIDIHQIPARGDEAAHYHYDIRYAMRATGGGGYVVSEESHDLGWIEIEKFNEFIDEASMLRMALKWKAQRNTRV